jgi:hypothetical protein
MKKALPLLVISLLVVFIFTDFAYTQSTTSLHYTRKGKEYFYKATNGGFELKTNIPYNVLRCNKCHPGKLANGTPVDTNTYAPSCQDCHNFAIGNGVADSTCLKCHSRQKAEIANFTDVHRTLGVKCYQCHTANEMHADGTNFNTMLDTTLGKTCSTTGCHAIVPVTPDDSLAHAIHNSKLECATCHVRSLITCYNCHFETELWSGMQQFKRPHKQLKGFILLGRDTKKGKINLINYQSLVYNGQSFIGYGPYYSHSVMVKDSTRGCSACHNNSFIQEFNQSGGQKITVAYWDTTTTPKGITQKPGVIPIPPNYQTTLKFDFVNYTGRIDTMYTNPAQWVFLKSQPDGQQMLSIYAQPLTWQQMQKLGSTVDIKKITTEIPSKFELRQNYPNPFNPVTTIQIRLSKPTDVTLRVHNILGQQVAVLLSGRKLGAGVYEYTFDASELPSGIYFYTLESSEFRDVKKMTLMK